jgi:hypothetical protein
MVSAKQILLFVNLATNIWIVADHVNTLLIDSHVVTNDQSFKSFRNFNFLLNVQHFIPLPDAFSDLNQVRLEFLRPPRALRLGLSTTTATRPDLSQFNLKIIGLDLNQDISETETSIEETCQIGRLSDTLVTFAARYPAELSEPCSCDTIHLVTNQISRRLDVQTLNCQLDGEAVQKCTQALERVCEQRLVFTPSSRPLNKTYVRFWEFCISEAERPRTGGNYYLSSVNDPDSSMFSASMSSSSFFDSSDTFQNSLSQPGEAVPEADDESHPSTISSNITNVGKVVGFTILLFLAAIILFMIVVNIIQYKFRNELLDDLEYASQNGTACHQPSESANNGQGNFWKKTFSANSLRRTLSVASLRSKRHARNRPVDEASSSSSSGGEEEEEEVKFEARQEASDDDDERVYARDAPRLRSEREVDSFYDSEAESEDGKDRLNKKKAVGRGGQDSVKNSRAVVIPRPCPV